MDALIQLFKKIGLVKVAILAGTLLVMLVSFSLIIMKYSAAQYVILYSNLEIEDSNKIIAELEQKNIPYELRANGEQILVPEDNVLRLRMELAQTGLPGKGTIVGYEIFDKGESLNTSNFIQNVHLQRAMEGELARTIASFKQIKKARVHLVIPKKELFAKIEQKPSASVVLELKNSASLSKDEVKAIGNLIASAVPGLDFRRVTIVDTLGRSLKLIEDEDEGLSYSNNSNEYRLEYERNLKKTIESLLEKTLGVGGVEAQVSAEMNFDREVTNSEIFDPDGQVVRSTQNSSESDSNSEGGSGDPSVSNNVPNGSGATSEQQQSASNSVKNDEIVNYEISKTVKNFIKQTGTLQKISIAVLIDGTYTTDPKTHKLIYTERTPEQVEQIKKLVKTAVGFNEERGDKIEVLNMQFRFGDDVAEEKVSLVDNFMYQLQGNYIELIKNFMILVTAVIVLFFFIRPVINKIIDTALSIPPSDNIDAKLAQQKLREEQARKAEEQARAEAENISKLQFTSFNENKNKTFRSVNDAVENCPDETINIIKSWLNN